MKPKLQLEFVRQQFPALDNEWILFDNAGGSQTLKTVIDRIGEQLLTADVQVGASYYQSQLASQRMEQVSTEMTSFINARHNSEIILGSSTTTLLRILSDSFRQVINEGDEIIVTNLDHEANIGCWRKLEKKGIIVKTWELNQDDFRLHTEDLEKLMTDKTRLVAFTACSNILGSITPIKEFTDFIHKRGALVCIDAVAYAPHELIDVQETDVDFYAFSFYKTYGPHYALLYGKKEHLRKLPGDNHFFIGQEEIPLKFQQGYVNFEIVWGISGIPNYLAKLSDLHYPDNTGVVLRKKMEQAYDLFKAQEEILSVRLLDYLNSKNKIKIIGEKSPDRTLRVPTISFIKEGYDSASIVSEIDKYKIGIKNGHFYAYRIIEDLGLLKQNGVIRVSLVHYNTIEEIDRLIVAFDKVL